MFNIIVNAEFVMYQLVQQTESTIRWQSIIGFAFQKYFIRKKFMDDGWKYRFLTKDLYLKFVSRHASLKEYIHVKVLMVFLFHISYYILYVISYQNRRHPLPAKELPEIVNAL